MSAKAEIMAAISKTDDPNMKTVLVLMVAVLEEISGEIRAMRADEQGLREAVLNGHTKSHDAHHEWIAKKIKDEEEEETADKASKRKIMDGLLERILWAVLCVIAGIGWVMK